MESTAPSRRSTPVEKPIRKSRSPKRGSARRVQRVVRPAPVTPIPRPRKQRAPDARPLHQEKMISGAILLGIVALSAALWATHHFSDSLRIIGVKLGGLEQQVVDNDARLELIPTLIHRIDQMHARTVQLRTTTDRLQREIRDLDRRLPRNANLSQLPQQLTLINHQLGDLEFRMDEGSNLAELQNLRTALSELQVRIQRINDQTAAVVQQVLIDGQGELSEEFLASIGGPAQPERWSINLSASSQLSEAEQIANAIEGEGLTVVIYRSDDAFRIRIEGFQDATKAKAYMIANLENPHFKDAWLSQTP